MGKAAMCISMLQILSTGRIYKISELADLLETNPRNIIEYKKELDEIANEFSGGIYIDTIPGRYGGYQLNGNAVIPSLHLSDKEKESIKEATRYLSSRNDFMQKKEFQKAVGKLMCSIVMKDIDLENNVTIINRFPLSMSENEIAERYNLIKEAIKNKKRIRFTYLSQKNVETDRVFDPYELFMYNNAYFVIGWQYANDNPGVRWFKLNRIKTIEITQEKYVKWKYFNKNDYIDEYGFKGNGEWYHVEFIAHGTYAALCKERIYGKNQVIESIDEYSTKVSVDMQNKENIRVFILGFGKNITLLEPQWLIEDLLDTSKHILELYK